MEIYIAGLGMFLPFFLLPLNANMEKRKGCIRREERLQWSSKSTIDFVLGPFYALFKIPFNAHIKLCCQISFTASQRVIKAEIVNYNNVQVPPKAAQSQAKSSFCVLQ